jgi:arabinofuranosyltransferase
MKHPKILILALALLAIFIFFKNAWVCDDSYINIRSIEQLHAGNGPVFNQGERVQVYTSPLWYWLIAAARTFCPDPFIILIATSFLIFLLILTALIKALPLNATLIFFLLAFTSNAFYDFTSSGLENILGYLLLLPLALYAKHPGPRLKLILYATFALAPIFRHDFVTIVAIPALYLIYLEPNLNFREKALRLFILSVPLLLWTFFSTIYYGCPIPNTALAKLFTGIPKLEIYKTGAQYFYSIYTRDPISILLLLAGIYAAFKSSLALNKAIGTGIVCNLLYIISVGGDFMSGRFISYAVFLSILMIAQATFTPSFITKVKKHKAAIIIIYFAYLIIIQHTPINTWSGLEDYTFDDGVADERAYYFKTASLFAYINNKPELAFPNLKWTRSGLSKKKDPNKIWVIKNIGFDGYWSGINSTIVDSYALSDPFLSRQPISKVIPWRIGHFERDVPEEYLKSLETKTNCFTDPKQAELYNLVCQATKSDKLFTKERFKAILKLNLNL